MTDTDTFLAHYGVMGMRWGHRKQQPVVTSQPKQDNSKRNKALAIAAITVIGAIGVGAVAYGLKSKKISLPKITRGKAALSKVLTKVNKKPVSEIRKAASRDSHTKQAAMNMLKTVKPTTPTIKTPSTVGAGFFDLPGGSPDLTPQQVSNIENAWDRWAK